MTKKKSSEESDSEVEEKMLEKIKQRERKKRKRMPVSGKEVFKIKELKEKSEE